MKKKSDPLESKLEERCREYIRSLGGELLKLKTPGTNGIPDRLLLLPAGWVVFVEFKRNARSAMQPLQPYWRKRLGVLGQLVWTIWDFETFVSRVKGL